VRTRPFGSFVAMTKEQINAMSKSEYNEVPQRRGEFAKRQ